MSQRFNVSENARVEIRGCRDRVTVAGWDDARTVAVDGAARQDGDSIIIESTRRVSVRVPRATPVTITHCEATVAVRDVAGRVELADIDGDVALSNLAGETRVRELEGDLSARNIATLKGEGAWHGDVFARGVKQIEANTIDGDVSIRAVDGDVKIAHVEGDLIVSGIRGAVDAPDVEGDAVISLDAVAAVNLRADGDVVLNLPSGANAELELDAPRGDLTARAPIQLIERDENHLRGALGAGGPTIKAESTRGDLILRVGGARPEYADYADYAEYAKYAGYGDMGRQIAEQVRESVEQSLNESGIRHHGKYRHFGFRFHGRDDAASEERAPDKPRGPAAGTPERQAILDAIARGELSVDDAIKKLTGEE